jgi:hypothetical protein
MDIKFLEVGVCGLSCRLCPTYHSKGESRCAGCKSPDRMAVGCPFITCAVKKKVVEFCWQCNESLTCEKLKNHREKGKQSDSFKCYQKLEDDIQFIKQYGVEKFEELEKIREAYLKKMLSGFNEGRSKSYYCIAATMLSLVELHSALKEANQSSNGLNLQEKSKILHAILNQIADEKNYSLKLRK